MVTRALVGMTIFAAGCANTLSYMPLVPAPRALFQKPAAGVELFAITPPARPITNIGLFQITQGDPDSTFDSMVAQIRTAAGKRGCDAMLITSIDQRRGKYSAPSIQASCVVYNDVPSSDFAASVSHHPISPPDAGPVTTPPAGPPSALWMAAVVGPAAAEMRTAPHLVAPLVTTLTPGQPVSVSREPTDGWRAVRLPDGRTGYLAEGLVRTDGTP